MDGAEGEWSTGTLVERIDTGGRTGVEIQYA